MDAIDRAARGVHKNLPHDPMRCGKAPETDCPECIVKLLHLRCMAHLEDTLKAQGIDPQLLADLNWHYTRQRLGDEIRDVLAQPLRLIQLELWDFFEDEAYAGELRPRVMDLIADDVVELIHLVIDERERNARKVRKSKARTR